jgi:hypothetical protein
VDTALKKVTDAIGNAFSSIQKGKEKSLDVVELIARRHLDKNQFGES